MWCILVLSTSGCISEYDFSGAEKQRSCDSVLEADAAVY